MTTADSFSARSELKVGNKTFTVFKLSALEKHGFQISRLPYSLRLLLENLLRREDGVTVTRDDIEALAGWDAKHPPLREIAFLPARCVLQDFTGVPAIVDLAAMRDAMNDLKGDPAKINPLIPVELVIDHSIQVDAFASPQAMETNIELDYSRNSERYAFLRWGQTAFKNFKVVPPNTGIVHQVNLEFLSRVVFVNDEGVAYPDTCVGTDSHTPMVNGLGVLAWGVGGIEAEAAMLGQPISMLIPDVIGFRLEGRLPEGSTATDLVLTITELLRKKGVVGKFVEFFGPGVASLTLADRATIGNMSPEYGATCAIFPPDEVTLQYLRFTGRPQEQIALVEAYMKEQGLFHSKDAPEPQFTDTLSLDLSTVEPSVAGPRRPQDRIPLGKIKSSFASTLPSLKPPHAAMDKPGKLRDGDVVIAAITSCTNTSNPSVMIAAGLLAKKAVVLGLERKPWVKTSLAPGSKVVTQYYDRADLTQYLDKLGFNLTGYGCTTCIGNSGPLPSEISEEINRRGLVAASVLSGNRNFEGRINPDVRANFLMSPPLVVAFAIAGTVNWDPYRDALGKTPDGKEIFLKDVWPTQNEIEEAVRAAVQADMYSTTYADVFTGDQRWNSMPIPRGDRFQWQENSTYVRQPNYFYKMSKEASTVARDIKGARAIAWLGDSITTDHISPAGNIKPASPAGRYLIQKGIEPKDFNSYGARRGNHEVMVRGTFANTRIRNRLAPNTEGGVTTHFPTGDVLSIFEAAERYVKSETALCVLAGKEYGSGSSRDWAAKGPFLQGIKFVIAESYERIHRSNLVGMGILPLQFIGGASADSLKLTGHEHFDIVGLRDAIASRFKNGREILIRARSEDGSTTDFKALVRIDTPQEVLYYLNGGILQYVVRQLAGGKQTPESLVAGVSGVAVSEPGKEGKRDECVQEASDESFPASDPPAY
jgi:aconitate hydratase